MKNTETTEKKSRVLNAVGGINDEFILEAAPTGRHEKRSYRGLIAAAMGTAAAAAVVLIAVFGGKGKPSEPIHQAKATNEPIVTNAPESTIEPEEIAIPTPQIKGMTARLRRTSSASSAQEWKEVHPEPGMDADGRTWNYDMELDHDYEFPTPAEVLTQADTAVFRGRVLKIENYTLNLEAEKSEHLHKFYIGVVTFLVEDCYRGGLEIGSEIRVFFLGGLTPNETVMNTFDGRGAGRFIWTQLRPEAEVIAVVHTPTGDDKGFVFYIGDPEVLPEDEYDKYILPYDGFVDHTYLPFSFGTMFLQVDDGFLYDHDVYTPDMLGENPSLDSAESYIKSLLSGLEL